MRAPMSFGCSAKWSVLNGFSAEQPFGRPAGVIRLRTADGEEYQWNKVTSTVYNLIIGKLYVDHGGIMRVRNMSTGLVARMKFKEQGLIRDRNPHQVSVAHLLPQ